MATTADFKNGLCIVHNNEIWSIVEFLHVKPGKGNTFVRTKLKNLKNGRVQEFRFDAGVKIDLARVERRPYQFLYKEGDTTYIFMHTETYEQLPIEKDLINNPDLILADEPTGNLDPATSSDIMELLVNINKQTGTTMVISTHDFMMINKYQSRLLVCEDGSLVEPQ